MLADAAEGVRIGSFRFSVTDLLFAVIVFAALLAATRWVQRVLEARVFPQTRLDAGMRNSLKMTVGYAGLLVAVAAGISTAGIDLSNLAIIAIATEIRFEIVRRFRERGIEIPFPQRDVHLRGLDAPAATGRADGSGGGSDREPGLNRPGLPGDPNPGDPNR